MVRTFVRTITRNCVARLAAMLARRLARTLGHTASRPPLTPPPTPTPPWLTQSEVSVQVFLKTRHIQYSFNNITNTFRIWQPPYDRRTTGEQAGPEQRGPRLRMPRQPNTAPRSNQYMYTVSVSPPRRVVMDQIMITSSRSTPASKRPGKKSSCPCRQSQQKKRQG